MKRKDQRILPYKEQEFMDYVIAVVIIPGLTLLALYLLPDYFPLLALTRPPDFFSVSLLKVNFVCSLPFLLVMCWQFNKTLFFPQYTPRIETRVICILAGLALALLLIANTLIFILHFTLFSPEHYTRCWEPFPFGEWHYAKTADICVQHGLAPVRFLNLAE